MYLLHITTLYTGVYGRCNTGVTTNVTWISHGDYCYHISDGQLNFDLSNKACKDHGANLTSLGSEQETDFVLDRYGRMNSVSNILSSNKQQAVKIHSRNTIVIK